MPAEVDFDHHSSEFHESRLAEWAEMRRCPVAHNPRYGGFWVVSGHPEVATVSRDAESFSSRYVASQDGGSDIDSDVDWLGIAGIPRPAALPPAGIAEVEGPVHTALRRAMNPHLVPQAIERQRPLMESAATWFLDEVIESGSADLVLDYASPVPAVLTMDLIGLPLDGWEHYAEVFHAMVAHPPRSEELKQAMRAIPTMLTELQAEITARREMPRDDLLSELIALEIDGRTLGDDDLVAVLWNLVGGGLDTTTSLTSLTLHHLAQHPDLRRRLIDEPHLLPSATEEFLRFFSVNETLTRTVAVDTELGGERLRRGDHLMLSWLSANRDERVFERADEVVLDRQHNPHLAFGVGPHRCIGMHLARVLFRVLVRQVLERIPDYSIEHEATRFYQGNPELNGVVTMPATFTPGPRVGRPVRPF